MPSGRQPSLQPISRRCLSTHASIRRCEHRGVDSRLPPLFADLLQLLLLEAGGLAEVDGNLVGGKLGIGMGHAVNLALDQVLVEWIQEDALLSTSCLSNSGGTASDT